ncbi:MAG TPA: MlaD family protein [Chthoniobacterales bacterium]|nr:MlaD family protein [Chthoniobacterales bacterium]
MQLRRNEILTGLLVLGTIAILVGTLILLGSPGLFRPLATYKVYFDNAAGIKLGAPVLLAGRKIGQVQKLYSPVTPEEERGARQAAAAMHPPPPGTSPTPADGKPKFEVRIDVQVDKSAQVYRDALVRMVTLGLLGEYAIDFTQGTEASGRAVDNQIFAGERAPDFSEAAAKLLDIVQPVANEATNTMKELQATAQNLARLTDQSSELNQALVQFKSFGENLVELTADDGALTLSLKNIQNISDQLKKNDNIEVTLRNFRSTSERLKSVMNEIEPVGRNVAAFSETIKTQPWRLIWPSTKTYPEASPSPADTITVRKSSKPKATPKRGR